MWENSLASFALLQKHAFLFFFLLLKIRIEFFKNWPKYLCILNTLYLSFVPSSQAHISADSGSFECSSHLRRLYTNFSMTSSSWYSSWARGRRWTWHAHHRGCSEFRRRRKKKVAKQEGNNRWSRLMLLKHVRERVCECSQRWQGGGGSVREKSSKWSNVALFLEKLHYLNIYYTSWQKNCTILQFILCIK